MGELRSIRLTRDAIVVTGPEAGWFLQGQLSQDLDGVPVGGSTWGWLLQPAGKVEALLRVTRTGPDILVADVDEGAGQAVFTRLVRYKLRTKVDLQLTTVSVGLLRGDGAAAAGEAVTAAEPTGTTVAVEALWTPAEEAVDVVAYGAPLGPLPGTELDASAWEAERVAVGVPRMGAELDERTIPGETGLVPRTVSFTKGCYTGQELVARIDSRGGNVPRRLRALRAADPLTVGAELVAGDKVVGTVTSAAVSSELGPVSLAYLGRAVVPPARVRDGAQDVDVVELPLLG
ncbi:MAG TPA: hypothetical protein VKV06_14540 [Acidimicrobiales bacterium]|nr:hypothetical protein [Acidimicrobiales bacterium]